MKNYFNPFKALCINNVLFKPRNYFGLILFILTSSFSNAIAAKSSQGINANINYEKIKKLVNELKQRDQGPFKGIYWYCSDGRVLHSKEEEKCNDSLAVQHGAPRDDLAKLYNQGIYIGQVLAGTSVSAIIDTDQRFNRLHQYLLQQWLTQYDDGWVFRKARFYRGSVQSEDEEVWGNKIREALVTKALYNPFNFEVKYFNRYLPSPGFEGNNREKIRWISKEISDSLTSFTTLRVKIHGQPSKDDLTQVQFFYNERQDKLNKWQEQKLKVLIELLHKEYTDAPAEMRRNLSKRGTLQRLDKEAILQLVDTLRSPMIRLKAGITLLSKLDAQLQLMASQKDKKPVLNRLESYRLIDQMTNELFFEIKPQTLREYVEYIRLSALYLKTNGYISSFELSLIQPKLTLSEPSSNSEELREIILQARALLEWSLATQRESTRQAIETFQSFEPLVNYYTDDRVRNSPLLTLGQRIDELSQFLQSTQKLENGKDKLLQGARGLQTGISKGYLRIIENGETDALTTKDIAVLISPPASLKPVAGILSLSEGNPVSHVQLLARNLGIPNGVILPQNLTSLSNLKNQEVILTVTPKGLVFVQLANQADIKQSNLLATKAVSRSMEKIRIDTQRLDLTNLELTSLDQLRSSNSGVNCGPKAANLGELSFLFPGRVARGFIIPFSVFDEHMNQIIPQKNITYKEFLKHVFKEAEIKRQQGTKDEEIDAYVIGKLAELRELIKSMTYTARFKKDLLNQYQKVFDKSPDKIGVFVRSDTNMEDLKDFTGAGLNKTVPNVVGLSNLEAAIREVWASPFSERSYLWRQKILDNPLDVYPSILLLESVNADASGVLLTSTLGESSPDDFMLSVNVGVGGAVDGQAAESWILPPLTPETNTFKMRFPAREPYANRLPNKGGFKSTINSWSTPILSLANLKSFREMGDLIAEKMSQAGMEAPFDSELGIKDDKVILFQVRPLVASKGGLARKYLADLDQTYQLQKINISLDQKVSP